MEDVYETIASVNLPTCALNEEQQKKIVAMALAKKPDRSVAQNKGRLVRFKGWRMAAAVAALCCLGALGVAAAEHFLQPAQVAQQLQQEELASLFAGKDAVEVQQTQKAGNYQVALLGLVSGKNVTEFWSSGWENGEPTEDRNYAVLAVTHLDGTPMAELSDENNELAPSNSLVSPVFASPDYPLAQYNIFTMNGARHDLVQGGVHYILVETDTLEPFADQDPQLAVILDKTGEIASLLNGFEQDPVSGKIAVNPDADCTLLLFDLPIEESKADPARAQELKNLWFGKEDDSEQPIPERTLEPKTVRETGALQSRETVTVTDGTYGKGWYFSEGGFIAYQDGWSAEKEDLLWASSDDGQAILVTHHEDDTVTVESWIIPMN